MAIHFPWQGPTDPQHRAKGTNYDNDKWGIIPDRNNVAPRVKAMAEALDQSVGEIVTALKVHELAEKTLVIFASDNGGYLHYAKSHFNISSNGALRGQKGGVQEGGHRVPCIAWWPGTIRPGQVSPQTVLTMDLFPALVALAGAVPPAGQKVDGIDVAPLLLRGEMLPQRMTFWRSDEQRAARYGPWKIDLSTVEHPLLYNLDSDFRETTNVAAAHPELVEKLKAAWFRWEKDVNRGFKSR